jgi:hypothetical protein
LSSQDKNQTDSSKSDDEGEGKQSNGMSVRSKEDMQERLGLGLKHMYLSVLKEPLPDDMLALLDQLDANDDDADNSRPDVDE